LSKYNVVHVLVTYDSMNMYILPNICYNIFFKKQINKRNKRKYYSNSLMTLDIEF